MDNRKLRLERTRTPSHLNTTEFPLRNSATKGSRRPLLNETTVGLPLSDPKIKTKPSTCYAINYETECDIAYNDYLQALLKRQITNKKLAQHKQILDEQLLVQSEILYKGNLKYEEVVRDTEMLEKQNRIIEIALFLEENLNNLKSIFAEYDLTFQANNFKEILKSECDKVVLKHVKPIRSQEEYDTFLCTLQECDLAMEKIVSSGRDFDGVHKLAEKIRNFMKLKDATQKLQDNVSRSEKEFMYKFLRNSSDSFATNYDIEPSAY